MGSGGGGGGELYVTVFNGQSHDIFICAFLC